MTIKPYGQRAPDADGLYFGPDVNEGRLILGLVTGLHGGLRGDKRLSLAAAAATATTASFTKPKAAQKRA